MSDPEHLGFGLHRMLPPALRGDFHDLRVWRRGVHEMLDLALRGHDGPIIVPMTLVDAGYFAESSAGCATDHRTVAQVADTIARSAGLSISPNTDGSVRTQLRRYATTLRHFRRG